MPIYEYECLQCGRRSERLQKMDEPPPACPACGGPVKKLFSAPAAHFKGSGWYVTDYGGRGKEKAAEGGAGAKEGKEGKEGKEAKAGKEGKEGGGTSEKPAAAEKSESKASEAKAGTGGGSDKGS
jgi:putative FmdB family regulatory protein